VRAAACAAVCALSPSLAGCVSSDAEPAPATQAPAAQERASARPAGLPPPIPGVTPADELIEPGEDHFAHLWRVTSDFDNAAEGYWSFGGDRLCFQAEPPGVPCDRIYVTDAATGTPLQISNGKGKTTCSYFLPGDTKVLYSSTHLKQEDCPPRPDYSKGYVWAVHPELDVFVHDLATGEETRLTRTWGYDAEATVSPLGDRIVFTSSRSGDLELWTCDLDGSHATQVTDRLGYDGGGFFSHDGRWIVYRRTRFQTASTEEQDEYRALLRDWTVRPLALDIWMVRPDGSESHRVTDLGGASFAPFFFPDDKRIIFSSNYHDPNRPQLEFDLFGVGLDGSDLERITTFRGFDSFPMFSPDGRWLAFASNRGAKRQGQTSLYLAEWR
jgi:TolB protein